MLYIYIYHTCLNSIPNRNKQNTSTQNSERQIYIYARGLRFCWCNVLMKPPPRSTQLGSPGALARARNLRAEVSPIKMQDLTIKKLGIWPSNLGTGWWLSPTIPTPLKNDVAWVKVSWDDFPFPILNGKIIQMFQSPPTSMYDYMEFIGTSSRPVVFFNLRNWAPEETGRLNKKCRLPALMRVLYHLVICYIAMERSTICNR